MFQQPYYASPAQLHQPRGIQVLACKLLYFPSLQYFVHLNKRWSQEHYASNAKDCQGSGSMNWKAKT